MDKEGQPLEVEIPEEIVAEIQIKGKKTSVTIPLKKFSTGSVGFFSSSKIETGENERYQVQIQAVLIGSKPKK